MSAKETTFKSSYKETNGTTRVGDALRWLVKQGKNISPEILNLAGDLSGVKVLNKLGSAIRKDDKLEPQDKELLLAELAKDLTMEKEVTKRWEADLHSDSWASKNIRPLTLAFLLANMFIFIILDSSLDGFKMAPEWINLLQGLLITAVGGYFVIRSGEKINNKIQYRKKLDADNNRL